MLRRLTAIVLLAVVLGCAPPIDYPTLYGQIQSGKCEEAVQYVQDAEQGYGRNQRLLYLLDMARANMLCGRYEEANAFFGRADLLAEELWTKSLTQEAASFLLNDYTRPYAGEDFERALINLNSALSYLALGDLEGALVEVRRLDQKLVGLEARYGTKNVYREDAFGRYLSGMAYEAEDNPYDAFIDFRKALMAYGRYRDDYRTPVPEALYEDLARAARASGRFDEVSGSLASSALEGPSWEQARKMGRLVLVHLAGRAPMKVQDKLLLPTPDAGPITVAFPRFIAVRPYCGSSTLKARPVAGGRAIRAESELVEDINAIAIKDLDDRAGRIMARTMARVVAKQVVIGAASKNLKSKRDQRSLKILYNLANVAIERADTRSWRTLPGEVHMARLLLPPGRYNVSVGMCGESEKHLRTVEVRAGETRFLLSQSDY